MEPERASPGVLRCVHGPLFINLSASEARGGCIRLSSVDNHTNHGVTISQDEPRGATGAGALGTSAAAAEMPLLQSEKPDSGGFVRGGGLQALKWGYLKRPIEIAGKV